MFTYGQLILVMIISSAKIICGDILVQPGYEHQYRYNPSYLPYQTVSHYKVPSAAEQYAKQLAEPLEQHPSGVQMIMHPYQVPEVYQDKARSNLVGYPFRLLHGYPHHRYVSTKPAGNLHYMKLGAREYIKPSIFIAHSNPLAAHYRYKRSFDFTNVKSNKPAIAAHDVATKPSLIDTKYSTAIDSLLPENKSTNTNDKHVKTQSDFAANSFLFGLNPNKMYSKLQTENLDEKDETQHPISKRNHATLITPVILTQQLTPDPAKTTVTEPAQQTSPKSQNKEQIQEPSRTNPKNLIPDASSTNLKQPTSLITTSQSSEEESHEDDSNYDNNDNIFTLPVRITYRPTIPFTYNRYWPSYITYNAEMYSNKKKNLDQQNTSNYPTHQPSSKTSSQETNVGATNTDQPRYRESTHLCAGGFPCSTNNIKKPFSEVVQSMATLTPEQSPTYRSYKSKESSLRSEMIAAPNPGTPQVFYTIPDDSVNYYFNDYMTDSRTDYLDNLETDYQDYDYDDKSTLPTNDFRIYLKGNPAYSSNVPSDKIDYYRYDNIFYRNSNPQSNIAPMTYVFPTSSRMQLSDYYPNKARKTHAYKPHHYYKYYTYDTKNRIVPNVFYRRIPYSYSYSPPVYY